jgi:ABC-type nitrate/sulfonate/bicarbonate transport system substrate-binding protein
VIYGLTCGAQAAERPPANVILDFIVGGKHAPRYVALEKVFYERNCLAIASSQDPFA